MDTIKAPQGEVGDLDICCLIAAPQKWVVKFLGMTSSVFMTQNDTFHVAKERAANQIITEFG